MTLKQVESGDRRELRWSRRAQVRAAGAARARLAGPCVIDPSTGVRTGGYSGVPFARTCYCGFAKGDVGVAWSTIANCAYPATGVLTCGSVWACPVCSAKVRRVRTIEVERVAEWHAGNGGELVMVTLTIRHTAGDRLSRLVSGLCEAWRGVQQSRTWMRRRRGLVGMVRALEVTQSFSTDADELAEGLPAVGGGWHPHLHVLLLVPRGGDAGLLAGEIAAELSESWGDSVAAELGERFRPLGSIGVDVRVIGAGAARYVTKISMEVTRADLKAADRSVWSLIDAGQFDYWSEFCAAMKGRRAVQFSHGLRAAAGLVLDESDETALALDLDEGVIVAYFEKRQWNRLMFDHREMLAILDAIAVRCRSVRVLSLSG